MDNIHNVCQEEGNGKLLSLLRDVKKMMKSNKLRRSSCFDAVIQKSGVGPNKGKQQFVLHEHGHIRTILEIPF